MPLQLGLIVSAALLVIGSLSAHWFADVERSGTSYQGLFADETCGFGLHDDQLIRYEAEMRTGVKAPPEPWECERESIVSFIPHVHNAIDALSLAAMLFAVLGGIAAAILAVVAAATGARRVAGAITIVASVALGLAAIDVVLFVVFGEMSLSSLSYGGLTFVAGAVTALVLSRRLVRA